MGIEMKFEQLSNQGFLNAVSNLARQRMPVKAAFNVKKLADAIMVERKKIAHSYMEEIAEKFAKRDDKGEKILEEGEIQFDLDDETKKEAFMKAQEAFGQKIVTINRPKLVVGVDITDGVELSASELSILDPVLSESLAASIAEAQVAPVIPFPGKVAETSPEAPTTA